MDVKGPGKGERCGGLDRGSYRQVEGRFRGGKRVRGDARVEEG